jgi:hypothetical protein
MKTEDWKCVILSSIKDEKSLINIAEILKDYDEAKNELKNKGYWDYNNMTTSVNELKTNYRHIYKFKFIRDLRKKYILNKFFPGITWNDIEKI